MGEPFKNLLNPSSVADIGTHLQRVWPRLDRRRFERMAAHGLDALEFKARALHLCEALAATLPPDFEAAADILEMSLAPVSPGAELSDLRTTSQGLAGWVVWPMSEYVARHGQQHPQRALATLHTMTQRFTAEWAIRPFIVNHPELSFATLRRWCADPSPHVRRLVSEGSRPRLPWGLQLKALIADPSPTLPLLEALHDDPSEYVRRSVANHLNDIAKDHPERIVQWLADHLPGADVNRRALLRHASRSLIKRGHAGVLAAWGLGKEWRGDAVFEVSPRKVRVGQSVTLTLCLQAKGRGPQQLLIDYVVHHVKANGSTAPKVFKGWLLTLASGESRTLLKQHALRRITTRSYYRGLHRVEVLINGKAAGEACFELRV